MNQVIDNFQAEQVKNLYEKYNINYFGVFGSAARNQLKPDSDIDILIDSEKILSLFDLADLKIELEKIFSRKIDLTLRDSIKPAIKPYVMQDLITIYDKN